LPINDNDQLSGRYLRDFDSLLASAAFPGFETTETDKYQNVQIAETHILIRTDQGGPHYTETVATQETRPVPPFPILVMTG
jgi:hypothetical protein